MTLVKICGVTRPEDAVLAGRLGAWAIGLVFAPCSPRRLTLEQAARVRDAIPAGVLSVGVFQGQGEEEIAEAARRCALDVVQRHGAADAPPGLEMASIRWVGAPENCASLAYVVEPRRSEEQRLSGTRPSREQQQAAWSAARELRGRGALVFVAGGLTAETVAEAATAASSDGVDVSSGVESAPGVKDPARLLAFFEALAARR